MLSFLIKYGKNFKKVHVHVKEKVIIFMKIHQCSSSMIMPNMAETDLRFHLDGIEIYHMRVHEHCLFSIPSPPLVHVNCLSFDRCRLLITVDRL